MLRLILIFGLEWFYYKTLLVKNAIIAFLSSKLQKDTFGSEAKKKIGKHTVPINVHSELEIHPSIILSPLII